MKCERTCNDLYAAHHVLSRLFPAVSVDHSCDLTAWFQRAGNADGSATTHARLHVVIDAHPREDQVHIFGCIKFRYVYHDHLIKGF